MRKVEEILDLLGVIIPTTDIPHKITSDECLVLHIQCGETVVPYKITDADVDKSSLEIVEVAITSSMECKWLERCSLLKHINLTEYERVYPTNDYSWWTSITYLRQHNIHMVDRRSE